jgi:hypothetical protein
MNLLLINNHKGNWMFNNIVSTIEFCIYHLLVVITSRISRIQPTGWAKRQDELLRRYLAPYVRNPHVTRRANSNSNQIGSDGTPSISVTYSNIQGGYAGTGNITGNPLFVDDRPYTEATTSAGDYHILPASPCIDRATGSGAPAVDIDGDNRPYDVAGKPNNPSAFDMGADEYIE